MSDEILATEAAIEQLLDGVDDGSLPVSLQALLPLVAAARQPATPGELAREGEMTAMFHAVRPPVRRPSAAARRRSVGIRVVAVAGLLSVTSATAAAAAGRLPEPVQETAAAVLAQVGISVPVPDAPSVEPADAPSEGVSPVPVTEAVVEATTIVPDGPVATPAPPGTDAAMVSEQPDEAAPPPADPDAPGQSCAPGQAKKDKTAEKAANGNGHAKAKKKK